MGMGSKLRALRGQAGMTRAEVAERLGVTSQTVFNWENGRGEPRGDKLDEVIALYGVSKDYLLVEDPLDGLSWDERELLDAYRAADPDGKLRLLVMAKGLIEYPLNPEAV